MLAPILLKVFFSDKFIVWFYPSASQNSLMSKVCIVLYLKRCYFKCSLFSDFANGLWTCFSILTGYFRGSQNVFSLIIKMSINCWMIHLANAKLINLNLSNTHKHIDVNRKWYRTDKRQSVRPCIDCRNLVRNALKERKDKQNTVGYLNITIDKMQLLGDSYLIIE